MKPGRDNKESNKRAYFGAKDKKREKARPPRVSSNAPADDGFPDRLDTQIEGRNAVLEAIKAGRTIDKVYASGGDTDRTLSYIVSLARQAGAVVSICDRRKLDSMSVTGAHQGVIAVAAAHVYADIEDMLARAGAQGKPPLLILCDGITDPHNLGAIIRTAEAAGAHGVIIPKHRSSGLTAVVDKASAGALEYMPVARVSNFASCIGDLKKQGIWIFCSEAKAGTELFKADFNRPCAIVIGSEGSGVSQIVSEKCDFSVGIPMFGKISSLNASAAAAILLYEAVRQREANR